MSQHDGERGLMLATLQAAIADIKDIKHWNKPPYVRRAILAYYWLHGSISDPWPFSFHAICTTLGLNPEAVLDEVRAEIEETRTHLNKR